MKTLLIALMLANVADAALTAHNTTYPHFHEDNYLLRPVTSRGPRAIGITFAVGGITEWIALRKIERHHRKLAKGLTITLLAGEAWGVSTSAR